MQTAARAGNIETMRRGLSSAVATRGAAWLTEADLLVAFQPSPRATGSLLHVIGDERGSPTWCQTMAALLQIVGDESFVRAKLWVDVADRTDETVLVKVLKGSRPHDGDPPRAQLAAVAMLLSYGASVRFVSFVRVMFATEIHQGLGRGDPAIMALLQDAQELGDGREAVRRLLRHPSRVLQTTAEWHEVSSLVGIRMLVEIPLRTLLATWAAQRERRRRAVAGIKGGPLLRVWTGVPRAFLAEVMTQMALTM